MTKLDELLEEATRALARMDAPALELLHERALELRALRDGGGAGTMETAARFRVFANVLRGTGQGLGVLGRMRGEGAAGGTPWGR